MYLKKQKLFHTVEERDRGRKKQAGEMGTTGYVKAYQLQPGDSVKLLPKRRAANKCVLKGITINVE